MKPEKKPRTPIPEPLAAKILFESDHTCCMCRNSSRVTIHHIDEDPSNNADENLAVLCSLCHGEVHSTGGFVRGRSREEVRLYNESWREIVRLRLQPNHIRNERAQLAIEVLVQASLECHFWKNELWQYGGATAPMFGESTGDVWDFVAAHWIPAYSEEMYRRCLPLMTDRLQELDRRWVILATSYADVLPVPFRTRLVRARRQLDLHQITYRMLPTMTRHFPAGVGTEAHWRSVFEGVMLTLGTVSREAETARKALESSGEKAV